MAAETGEVGTYTRPLMAALRLASVPAIVINEELFEPEVMVSPLVEPNVSLPNEAESVSESEAPDAAGSEWLMDEPANV